MERTQTLGRTHLESEEFAYPNGGKTRKGRAAFGAYGAQTVRVVAGIPDTYFTIPASAFVKGRRIAGYLTVDTVDGLSSSENPEFVFHANKA